MALAFWGPAFILDSAPSSHHTKAHLSQIQLQGSYCGFAVWTIKAESGSWPYLAGCIVKCILAIKAPLFPWHKGSFSAEVSSGISLNTASFDLFEWSSHFCFSYSLQKYFMRKLNAENMKCLSVPFEVEHQTILSRESAPESSDKTLYLWESSLEPAQETFLSPQNLSGISCVFICLLIPFLKPRGLASFHVYST